MAIKKDIKTWAIKVRGRSFYQSLSTGMPYFYAVKQEASHAAKTIAHLHNCKAEPIRVRVRIEEIE